MRGTPPPLTENGRKFSSNMGQKGLILAFFGQKQLFFSGLGSDKNEDDNNGDDDGDADYDGDDDCDDNEYIYDNDDNELTSVKF